jgi:hypothetical protein
MSKSYNKIRSLKLIANKRKNNNSKKKTLTMNKYSKKMFIFYNPMLKILEKETNISYYFSIRENSIMHNFLTYIYLQFNYYNKIINTLNIASTRNLNSNVSEKINIIIKDNLSKSKYIDANIITYISNNISNCKIITYKNSINNKKYVFDFIIYDKININNLDNIVKNMLIFLQILIKISKNLNNEINECSKDGVSITFFLTPFLKKLNITNNKNKEILGANNVNSGFNYTCLNSGLIFIYRKEDFFKVFVHESVHAYGIDRALHFDFNKNQNYNKFLSIFAFANKDTTDIGINEAVTEFWTSILYLCINSYQYSKSLQNFIYNYERLYKTELIHALYQISKILHYNDLTYNTFINNSNSKYRENSHIFSYFIVKTLMIINHEHMLNSQLFDLNSISKLDNIENNSPINIKLKQDDITMNKLFVNLYEYAKDPLFIKIMTNIEVEHRKHYKKYKNIKTRKLIKKLKQKTRNFLTQKSRTNHIINMENYMLTNLKMMIYDYNI